MSTDKTNQSWGGRFSEPVDAFVARFTASVTFDQRLYRHDIMGSIAHATMLAKVGVLTDAERDSIIDGLNTIQGEIEAGQFDWRVDLEDVHMNIEARLTDRIGVTGKKLHTGRSRNDQVATDIRLWLRDEIDLILAEITRLQKGLLEQAEREAASIMPGFTHLQTAQPVTFGHHMLAWFEMLSRDYERLVDCRKRTNRMPLGSAALAGTTYPIDREYTAQLLGFDAVGGNSLDNVSDRDFAIQQILNRAVISTEIVDILAAAGITTPDISILSDEFLAEVQQLEKKNLALEALRKLLNDEIRSRSKTNVVETKRFSERLEAAIARYHTNAISTVEVLQELIDLAKEVRAARRRGEDEGLSQDEIAFYDALAENESAVQVMGNDSLKVIAHELLTNLKSTVSVDWSHRESARARMRVLVKRILRKHGYPPDLQDAAVQTVLRQAEALSAQWNT